ncbi:MAG: AAA domain-containing protein [Proteobacteria bacterium]|nr:AAA domain-containing protein [Pseudomonadota bacterium]
MGKEKILNEFSKNSLEIFEKAKEIALNHGGKMSPYHLMIAFLSEERNLLRHFIPIRKISSALKSEKLMGKEKTSDTIIVTKHIQSILKKAVKIKQKNRNEKVTPPELFLALAEDEKIVKLLESFSVNLNKFNEEMTKIGFDEEKYNKIKRLNLLDKYIERNITGQSKARKKVMSVLRMVKLGLDVKPERPDGIFLFLGPVGTGKYSMAKAIAKYFSDGKFNLLNFDMDLYQDAWDFDKFLDILSHNIRSTDEDKSEEGVIVFNKIDLTHPSIVNFMVDALGKGNFPGTDGQIHSFSKYTVMFIPSDKLSRRHAKIGFINSKGKVNYEDYLKGISKPLLSIVDDVVVFRKLEPVELERVAKRNVKVVLDRIAREYNIKIKYSDNVIKYIAEESYKKEMGRREVNKMIDEYVSLPIVNLFVQKGISNIHINVKNKKIVLEYANGKRKQS